MEDVLFSHRGYSVRPWRCADRETAANVVKQCLEAYGLSFEPEGADLDALDVENHYQRDNRGEFWVVMEDGTNEVIGTAGYYEVEDKNGEDSKCVEVRKMYLLPEARGKKLGRTILQVNPATTELDSDSSPTPTARSMILLALSLSLQRLEEVIASKGYRRIIVETATVLHEACRLYESSGYCPSGGVETDRCYCRLYKDLPER